MAIDYWPQLLSGQAPGGRRKEATATWATSDGYNVKKGHGRATLPVRNQRESEGRGKMHIVLDSADEMGSLNDIAI